MIPVTTVTARVLAKVNLQLAVGPVRRDGYHELVTVFHAVSLFDEVTVAPADCDSVTVTGEGVGSVPADETNLAARAARALAQEAAPDRGDAPGLAIRIRKRIPVAAGLAGGSADAAATLVACNELWRTGLSQQELCELAGGIGSDVAFALLGGTAIGVGRGDSVTPALTAGTYHWVLAFAAGGLSTAAVYAACDRLRAARGERPAARGPAMDTALLAALRSGGGGAGAVRRPGVVHGDAGERGQHAHRFHGLRPAPGVAEDQGVLAGAGAVHPVQPAFRPQPGLIEAGNAGPGDPGADLLQEAARRPAR